MTSCTATEQQKTMMLSSRCLTPNRLLVCHGRRLDSSLLQNRRAPLFGQQVKTRLLHARRNRHRFLSCESTPVEGSKLRCAVITLQEPPKSEHETGNPLRLAGIVIRNPETGITTELAVTLDDATKRNISREVDLPRGEFSPC